MMRSLYSGVSGLRVHQTKMDVIGNNISNVNTVGFKASTVTFSDILYQTTQILGMPLEDIKRHITVLSVEKKVVLKKEQEECCIYLAIYYYLELNTAKMLLDLSVVYPISGEAILARLTQIEKKLSLALDEMQRQAVIEAVRNGLFILTGGPGTGKTTTINAMIQFFESEWIFYWQRPQDGLQSE